MAQFTVVPSPLSFLRRLVRADVVVPVLIINPFPPRRFRSAWYLANRAPAGPS